MRILHTVESYDPSIGGMQEVVRQLSERLSKLGHEVVVATKYLPIRKNLIINNVRIEQFKISGNAVYGFIGNRKEIERYKTFLLNSDFDIITNFAAQQWTTDLAFPILDNIKAKKVFVPTGFSGLYLPEYKDYFKNMKHWMRKYDINVFLSNNYRDISFAKKNAIKKIVVIPNGASEEEFLSTEYVDIRKKLNIPIGNFFILLVGAHTGTKGHREAIKIFKKAKINNTIFLIIANTFNNGCKWHCVLENKLFNLSPKRLIDKKRIVIRSFSRQITINAYKEADLFLFPSNVECSPLVLFECMASNTPFITTDVGNSKEIIKWSGSGMILPTFVDKYGNSKAKINESVDVLEYLFNNPGKRKQMAKSGFKVWKKRFTWAKKAKEYNKIYLKLLNKNKT